jgi:hypothetical protein
MPGRQQTEADSQCLAQAGFPLAEPAGLFCWVHKVRDQAERAGAYRYFVETRRRIQRSWGRTGFRDGQVNDALQVVDPESGRTVVFVYRQEGSQDEERIFPRGPQSGASYSVPLEEAGGGQIVSGRELMENGIAVPLPRTYSAEVIHLDTEPRP